MHNVERNEVDPRSHDLVRERPRMASGGGGRFERVHEPPGVGFRSGQLVVTGFLLRPGGSVRALVVQCDCGRPEHRVDQYAFKDGRAVRCNACGKEQACASRQKHYLHYAGACPDVVHRRRLLNRIGALRNRCHNPNDRQFKAYGARGIRCWWFVQFGDEPKAGTGRAGRALKTLRWKYEMLQYLVALPGWDQPALELDRIDNDRGYEPGNLQFTSRGTNNRNKRQVNPMSLRILALEAEVARLRSIERGAA